MVKNRLTQLERAEAAERARLDAELTREYAALSDDDLVALIAESVQRGPHAADLHALTDAELAAFVASVRAETGLAEMRAASDALRAFKAGRVKGNAGECKTLT